MPTTPEPIHEARKSIVHIGLHAAGPLTGEASAADDFQRLTVLIGATIVAWHAQEFLTALAEVAPERAFQLAAEFTTEFEDYDGYSGEMLYDLAAKLGVPEMRRKPIPDRHNVGGHVYDLNRDYRDQAGQVWRFLEWDKTEPAFISLHSGKEIPGAMAGVVSRLPRLVAERGPLAEVDGDAAEAGAR